MSEQPQNLTTTQPSKIVRRVCPKCNQIIKTAETNCSRCGKPLQSVAVIKRSGAFAIVIGTIFLALASWLSLSLYHAITQLGHPGATRTFNGGSTEIAFFAIVFALMFSLGLTFIAAGLWQVIFGTRNKLLAFVVLIIVSIFIVTGIAAVLLNIIPGGGKPARYSTNSD